MGNRVQARMRGAAMGFGLALSWLGAGVAPAQSGQLQYVTMEDGELGVSVGKLPFFAGWHGNAHADHSDPLQDFDGLPALTMTSPDGSETIRQFGRPLDTVNPYLAGMARDYSGIAVTRFISTANILTSYVLPALQLGGEPSAPMPYAQDAVAKIQNGTTPGAFGDAAAVLIRNVNGGKEIFLWGVTYGKNGGTRAESSQTFVQMVTAPPGQARALADRYRTLPGLQINPEWAQRSHTRAQRVAQMSADQKVQFNTTQAEMNRRNNQSNESARESQWDRFNRSAQGTSDQHQAALDNANLTKTQRAGTHSYFAWCNATGNVRRQRDSLNSPGPGYQRCPAKDEER